MLGFSLCAKEYAPETIDQTINRQQGRSNQELEHLYQEKTKLHGKQFVKHSPEMRLLMKSLKYRKKLEAGEITREQFHEMMQNKKRAFELNLARENRKYGKKEEKFFAKCVSASSKKLEKMRKNLPGSSEHLKA